MISSLLRRFSILAAAVSCVALSNIRPLPKEHSLLAEYLHSSVQTIVGTNLLLIGVIALIWYLLGKRSGKTVESVEEKGD